MEKKWTPEQQKIITLRNRNLLVSASAGAGKTAALVARILAMIEEGVSVTSLLVLTFTKAAAAEMRKRVWEELEKIAAKEGAHEHVRKQLSLLPDAYITTIHSFCQNVIRNYFHLIDLDPAFRIGEDAELTLLRADVLTELLEQKYIEGSEDFLEFLECYAGGKSDEALEALILKLYDMSRGYLWPEEWLASQAAMYQIDSLKELEEAVLIKQLCQYLHDMIEDAMKWNQKAFELCKGVDGPLAYLDALSEDLETLSLLHQAKSYQEFERCFLELSFAALSRKKQTDASEDKKEEVKLLRKQMKDLLSKLKKEFFFQTSEEMLSDMKIAEKSVHVLTGLVTDFAGQYAKKKEEKNLFDFSDLEHFALKILHRREKNEILPTLAAEEISGQFTEIMIDEYQDSNLVQEIMLSCISKERKGQPNTFMVGDVKQSIYKFRLAKPELFLEKYHSYSKEESSHQKIVLQTNYRSRPVILDGVNYIFERIMRQQLGGISYDDEARLNAGAVFMSCPEGRESKRTELLLVAEEEAETMETSKEEVDEFFQEEPEAELGLRELEAKAAAKRIQELVQPETGLMIASENGYRAANYGDVVILLRAMTGWLETFVRVLEEEGIPVYSDQQSGYFLAIEIRTVLNYLRILDNPRQDIALAAVLYSKITGMKSEELAKIRILYGRKSLYEAARSYLDQGEDVVIKKKLEVFFGCFDELRQKVSHSKVGKLILEVYQRTGFYHYVAAMPGGERRQGNLEMLLEQAAVFEAGSYSGLFQFVRYVERLLKKNIDYGESIRYDGSNAVRITSIHKSKGLEYPVVLLAGMGKLFNHQDIREKIVIHADYGLGLDCIDVQRRTKIETLQKKVLQRFTVLENLGEELRLFYVAMTRAKEKLILLGSIKKLNKTWDKYVSTPDFLPYSSLVQARSYLDYAAPIILKNCLIPLYGKELLDNSGLFSITIIKDTDLKQKPEEKQPKLSKEVQFGRVSEVLLQNTLQECLAYQYPFDMDIALPVKVSVSELKKVSQQEEARENEIALPEYVQEEVERTLPVFLQKENVMRGADRGTLYHRVLEKVTPCRASNRDQMVEALGKLTEQGILSEQEQAALRLDELEAFYTSSLAERMRQAENKELLFLEQPFVMGIPYHQVQEEYKGDEAIMIQGMIDAYFEEPDGLVLVDYKTDRIALGDEDTLVKRYRKQFFYYEQALNQLTGKQIKEKIIFSFSLLKEIKMM